MEVWMKMDYPQTYNTKLQVVIVVYLFYLIDRSYERTKSTDTQEKTAVQVKFFGKGNFIFI